MLFKHFILVMRTQFLDTEIKEKGYLEKCNCVLVVISEFELIIFGTFVSGSLSVQDVLEM